MAEENPRKDKEEPKFIMGFKGVDEFSQEGIKRVIEATRAFQALPQAGPLWDLQKSYPEFSRAMKNSRTRILPIMKTLLQHVKIPTHDFKRRDLDEKLDFLVESNDDILERIGSALDEASGLSAKTEILVVNPTGRAATKAPGIWAKRKPADASEDFIDSTIVAEHANPSSLKPRPMKKAVHRILDKPQLKFKTPVDNSLTPFVPILKDKPNSLKPLSILPEYNGKNEEFYGHPYQVELNRWQADDQHTKKVTPIVPDDVEKQPWMLVQTVEELESMLRELRKVNELAVDVEHHSYRTFLGISCLLQISTRNLDYVVDAIALRDDLGCLNEVFTKPKIMKVFHGASSDIEWLQRDFGLYVVGMFDTYVAAKQLGMQQLSLQHLLYKYCQVTANKKYQLSDWRIRPLPDDMLNYARQDTHFLLYIYDLMKNELIDTGNQFNNLLTAVYDESTVICLKRYEKPTVNPQLTLRKTRRVLNNRQIYAYTEIYKWRDGLAREKDESLGYVLPNHMLFMIAESLPKEMTGILACCDPVPYLVQANLGVIHQIVLKARDLPLHEEKVQIGADEKRKKLKNWVIIMNSIHDIEGDLPEDYSSGSQLKKDIDYSGKTFPEPWVNPPDMNGIQVRSHSTFLFGQATKRTIGTKTPILSSSNAFERYKLSSQILEMLKDPKKKNELDMEDPTVKVVYDTIYVDPAEEEEASKKKLSVVNPELIKVMPKSNFVPFNPVAELMKQQASENKKNKKKKVKYETWDDDKSHQNSNTIPDAGVDLEDGEIETKLNSDDSESQSNVPIPKSKSEKRRGKKKSRAKVVEKLLFWKTKRKLEEEENNEDVICLDPPEATGPTPPKKFKDFQKERYPETAGGSGRGRNKGRGDRDQREGKNERGRGRKSSGDGKSHRGKRGGIFNAFRRNEGRSVTYK